MARLLNAMQRARAERGAPALPRLEELGGGADDHRLLLEVRDLLRDQTRLLRERTGRPDAREA